MSIRVLVTGASGFIGSHLAEQLAQRGYEVFCLVRKTSNVEFLKTIDVHLLYGALEDKESLKKAVAEMDYIYHPAGLIKARRPRDYYLVNCDGTRNLLQAVIDTQQAIKRFVFFSSQAASGPSRDGAPITETSPCYPITDYGKSKLEAEKAVRELADAHSIPFTIIRPPAVFGPRDKEILFYFQQAQKGSIPVIGSPDNQFSIVYVRDLVEGTILAGESEKAINETYFICYPEALTWRRVAELLGKTLETNCRVKTIPYPVAYGVAIINELFATLIGRSAMINRQKLREFNQAYWICSPNKIKVHLGFSAQTNLTDALQATADWYKSAGWL
ncbi:NAD-dependent epimerase/dehydratase family protein [Candidatus Sumerlaeota bacterium]|nr:NAD-dependent epimerase/dehydratase family protein [Candidatus Sumerlaeota bacterium]